MAFDESDRLARIEGLVEAQQRQIDELKAENRRLRLVPGPRPVASDQPTVEANGGASQPNAEADEPEGIGRRRLLLGGATAAAAATAAVLGTSASPAAAANGGALTMGVTTNTSTAQTTWTPTTNGEAPALFIDQQGSAIGLRVWSLAGDAVNGYAGDGNGVLGQSDAGVGVWGNGFGQAKGVVGAAGASEGVWGQSDTGRGVFGRSESNKGVWGVSISDVGVLGRGPVAVEAQGSQVNLRLTSDGDRVAPTSDTTAHARGDVVLDGAGTVWLCTAAGTPGTWRRIGGPTSAGAFHVLPAPARVYDSRANTSPAQGPKTPLSGNTARTIDCTHNNSGVPLGATAVALTVLLVNAFNGSGNLTIWANGAPRPQANTAVWGAGSGRYTTSTICAVDAAAKLQAAASAKTDLVLDVVGYYR